MTSLRSDLLVLLALFRANWRTHHAAPGKTFFLSFFMFVQNTLFFCLWIIFFQAVGSVRGWHIEDMAILYGFLGTSTGLSLFLFDGCRQIPMRIQDNSLDSYLTRPISPLPLLLFSRSNAASLGDIITGPLYWIFFAKVSFTLFWSLIALSLITTVFVTSVCIIFFSLPFWLTKSTRLPDQLFDMMIIFATSQPQTQEFLTKIVMFSVLPAGFIGYLPVLIVREGHVWQYGAFFLGAILYAFLAVLIFNKGLRRYRQSNA